MRINDKSYLLDQTHDSDFLECWDVLLQFFLLLNEVHEYLHLTTQLKWLEFKLQPLIQTQQLRVDMLNNSILQLNTSDSTYSMNISKKMYLE